MEIHSTGAEKPYQILLRNYYDYSHEVLCLIKILIVRISEARTATQLHLLEFDKRFGAFDNFSFWDFNDPLNLPEVLKSKFDLILMDPPFLNAGRFQRYHNILIFVGML